MGMKANTPQFSAELRAISVASFAEASAAVRQLALQGLANLNQETPVDTGRARANWQLGIEDAPQGTLFNDDAAKLRAARVSLSTARKAEKLLAKRRKGGKAAGGDAGADARDEELAAAKKATARASRAFASGKRSGAAISSSASLAAGQAKIASFDIGKDRKVWLVNNLPYIRRLNEGHSKQNTPGWIERAMQNALRSLRPGGGNG